MPQRPQHYQGAVTRSVSLDYLLHLPAAYAESGDPWPVILFLHGAGERGSDLKLVKKHGIPKIAARRRSFPFIAISPQCPAGSHWMHHFDALLGLLDDVLARHNADARRVYLTGLSMGGNGAWGLAARAPERFAAVAPICGHDLWLVGLPERAGALKGMGVWAFHGARDWVVPPMWSAEACKAVTDAGGEARLTIYPLADHDSWTETYDNPELYAWFLQHRR
jgi:predicted peptidase